MNKEEATKFLAIIKVAYPSTYKDIGKDMAIATVNMWQRTFANVPYVIMEMAFDHFRKVSQFAPTPADMITELKDLYYTAVSEALTSDSEEKLKLSEYIIKHTSSFRETPKMEINYAALNKKLLKNGENQKCLYEGG